MIVSIQFSRQIRMGKSESDRVAKAVTNGLCLGCDQKADDLTRQLCGSCYQASRRLIRSGATTEAEEIKAGRLLAKDESSIGRPRTNPISKAVKEAS